MDPNSRTKSALLERANGNVTQLIRRFDNIIAYASDENNDRNAAASGAYQLNVESGALIRAAEDILSLTRTLKEEWLFGRLQNVGTSEAEKKAAAASAKVFEALGQGETNGRHDEGDRVMSDANDEAT